MTFLGSGTSATRGMSELDSKAKVAQRRLLEEETVPLLMITIDKKMINNE